MVDFEGQRYERLSISGKTTSNYLRVPILGTGVFEVLSMSLHPSSSLSYAMPASLQVYWDDGVAEYYRFLKTGYFGARQGLEVNNIIVVGPAILQAWMEDALTYGGGARLDLTYRRIA